MLVPYDARTNAKGVDRGVVDKSINATTDALIFQCSINVAKSSLLGFFG
jgi:hypothetical protein